MNKFVPLLSALALSVAGVASADVADVAEDPPEDARPKVVVLVSVTAPGGVASSFGSQGTDEISVRTIIAKALTERGFEIVSAAGEKITRIATGEEAASDLLADASAADLARRLGAGVAVIVGLEGKSDGRIRGTPLSGGISKGAARLLDVSSSRAVHDENLDGAGWGKTIDAAVERAFRNAARDAAAVIAAKADKAWPADVNVGTSRVKVSIRGARTWGSVSSVIRRLATTKGVRAVHPEAVSGDAVKLGLETSLSTSKLIAAIRDTRLVNGSLSAKADGGSINVSVRGD